MIKKIDHIGIAVKDLEAALKLYEEVLGLEICWDRSCGRAKG